MPLMEQSGRSLGPGTVSRSFALLACSLCGILGWTSLIGSAPPAPRPKLCAPLHDFCISRVDDHLFFANPFPKLANFHTHSHYRRTPWFPVRGKSPWNGRLAQRHGGQPPGNLRGRNQKGIYHSQTFSPVGITKSFAPVPGQTWGKQQRGTPDCPAGLIDRCSTHNGKELARHLSQTPLLSRSRAPTK
jgi:hypothetical protein